MWELFGRAHRYRDHPVDRAISPIWAEDGAGDSASPPVATSSSSTVTQLPWLTDAVQDLHPSLALWSTDDTAPLPSTAFADVVAAAAESSR